MSTYETDGWSGSSKTRTKKKSLNPVWNETLMLLIDSEDTSGRILFEVMDWDALTDDDLIGGFSISVQELIHNPADGYFRLLGPNEAVHYNLPLAYSNEKLCEIKEALRYKHFYLSSN